MPPTRGARGKDGDHRKTGKTPGESLPDAGMEGGRDRQETPKNSRASCSPAYRTDGGSAGWKHPVHRPHGATRGVAAACVRSQAQRTRSSLSLSPPCRSPHSTGSSVRCGFRRVIQHPVVPRCPGARVAHLVWAGRGDRRFQAAGDRDIKSSTNWENCQTYFCLYPWFTLGFEVYCLRD